MVCAATPSRERRQTPTEPRIALAFYGLFRAIPFTFANIEANLIAPLLDATPFVDIFLHSLLVSRRIVERGGGGNGGDTRASIAPAPDPFAFLAFNATRRLCSFAVEEQGVVDVDNNISERVREEWVAAGNRNLRVKHRYTRASFSNILRGTYSLFAASKLVRSREWRVGINYSHIVFARPDIRLQTPLRWRDFPFRAVPGHLIMVPNTQHHGGLNDRFAFGTRDAMLHLATQFPTEAAATALSISRGKNSEQRRAVHLNLLVPNVTIAFTPLCLVRVRSSGGVVPHDPIARRQPFRPLPRLIPLLRPGIDDTVQPCGSS